MNLRAYTERREGDSPSDDELARAYLDGITPPSPDHHEAHLRGLRSVAALSGLPARPAVPKEPSGECIVGKISTLEAFLPSGVASDADKWRTLVAWLERQRAALRPPTDEGRAGSVQSLKEFDDKYLPELARRHEFDTPTGSEQ